MPDLGQRQKLFSRFLGLLLTHIYEQGWECSMAEGYVGDTDAKDGDYDGPHLKNGAHYNRLGQDLNLFIEGVLVSKSTHPAWETLAKFWEALHPLCRAGLRFGDANHFSIEWNGIK